MKVSATVEISDSFEKGDCFNCPFSTDELDINGFIPICPFWWIEGCPAEVVEE